MVSDKRCCVPGCLGARSSRSVLHAFPNPVVYPERFQTWVTSIRGDILTLSTEQIYQFRRVCRKHFEQKFWCRNNRLSNIAIPTMNLPDLSTNEPGIDVSESINENVQPISQVPQKSQSVLSVMERDNIMDVVETHNENLLTSPSTSQGLSLHQKPLRSIENILHTLHSSSKGTTCQKRNKTSLKLKATTEAERALYTKLLASRVKVSRYKSLNKKQSVAIKSAKKLFSDKYLLKVLEDLPKSTRLLINMQLRENKKKNKGRRFSTEDKIVALSLFKQSPKGYRILRKFLILPAPQTLMKLINSANIQPGINTNIFSQLKKQAETMTAIDKLCIFIYDEMALKAGINYNERTDKVIGFVTNGEQTVKEFADHAQVFMIRGLVRNYKQPVGYTFSAGPTKGRELARQIKIFICEIMKAGLTVVTTVCDQGSGNRLAIKHLIEDSRTTWLRVGIDPKPNLILVDSMEIVPLYDPPHLIKCVRNNLMTKNLQFKSSEGLRIAKWSHVEYLYKENPAYQGIRIIPKLTDNHVVHSKISKMKVKYATQLFSQTVASNMGYLAEKRIIPEECKATADIFLFFDKLFDSLNGSYNQKYKFVKPALGPATPTSVHHQIWFEARRILKDMKFISENNRREAVPTLVNWAWTLEGVEVLLKKLDRDYGVNSVWMRHLNQDPLENFFGAIRSHGCRNTNPTPDKFQYAFSTLLINSLASAHAPGANCEKDFASALYALVIHQDSKASTVIDIDFKNFEIKETSLINKLNNPTIKAGLTYCSGYFAKQLKKRVFKKCAVCQNNFISKVESEYISYREFSKKCWLCSPTFDMLKVISRIQDVIYEIMKNKIESKLLKEFVKTIILMTVDFNFIKCDKHKDALIDHLIKIACRFFIYNYCKNINSIISGKRSKDDEEDLLQIKAKIYSGKFFKKNK